MLLVISSVSLSAAVVGQDEKNRVEELGSPRDAKPGETYLLTSADKMKYFLRLPKSYDPEKGARLILFMHGSNMNGLDYLRSFEGAGWCNDDILCCPNGEAAGDDPYGPNNYGFASANPVSALTKELQSEQDSGLKITRTYIGGHSQGGFVTYSVIMHFPDLYQGAFPMAGDCWMQNEPNLWDEHPETVAKQKRIPIAVIHGKADPVVSFSQGEHAYGVFQAAGYPKLRFFAPEQLGHQFMLSPVDEALKWLDAMNGADPVNSMELAKKWSAENEWGWAHQAALAVMNNPESDEATRKIANGIIEQIEEPAAAAVKEIAKKIRDDKSGKWVEDWYRFHGQFGATKAAEAIVANYTKRRDGHRKPATDLFYEALQMIRDEAKKSEGYGKLETLLKDYPCTFHACYANSFLKNRPDKPAEKPFR